MPTCGGEDGGWKNPSSDEIKSLLKKSKTIAVVGLSPKPDRASNRVAAYLMKQGFRIIPVNPNEETIMGLKSYPDLKSTPDKIDIVDVFRKPGDVPAIVDEAIVCGAEAVWMQESVVSPEAFYRGEQAGLIMVMDRCMFKEHSRLIG